MGMTIDEALNYMPCLMEACSHCLVRGCDKPIEKIEEVKIVAMDTMRKYQKIEDLWNRCHTFDHDKYFQMIGQIIEKGDIQIY